MSNHQPSSPPTLSDNEDSRNSNGIHQEDDGQALAAEEGRRRQDQGEEEIVDPEIILDEYGVPLPPPVPLCKSEGTLDNHHDGTGSSEEQQLLLAQQLNNDDGATPSATAPHKTDEPVDGDGEEVQVIISGDGDNAEETIILDENGEPMPSPMRLPKSIPLAEAIPSSPDHDSMHPNNDDNGIIIIPSVHAVAVNAVAVDSIATTSTARGGVNDLGGTIPTTTTTGHRNSLEQMPSVQAVPMGTAVGAEERMEEPSSWWKKRRIVLGLSFIIGILITIILVLTVSNSNGKGGDAASSSPEMTLGGGNEFKPTSMVTTPEPTPTSEATLKPATPSPTKTQQVCAANYGQAKANCLDMNKRCPTGGGCGAGESCFSVPDDMCGVTDEPTPLPTAKPTPGPSQAIIGDMLSLDNSEAAAKPTTPGFFMICGESYSDAQDNCRTNNGCPTGFECPGTTICFALPEASCPEPTTATTTTTTEPTSTGTTINYVEDELDFASYGYPYSPEGVEGIRVQPDHDSATSSTIHHNIGSAQECAAKCQEESASSGSWSEKLQICRCYLVDVEFICFDPCAVEDQSFEDDLITWSIAELGYCDESICKNATEFNEAISESSELEDGPSIDDSAIEIPADSDVPITQSSSFELVPTDTISPSVASAPGKTVAIHGNTAIIGAPENDDAKGSAFVFVRDIATGEWSQQAKLVHPSRWAGAKFGWSVAIHDDTIVVGNILTDASAHIFVKNGSEWSHQARLFHPDFPGGLGLGMFGSTVGIYNDTVVVGSSLDIKDGSAHVFVRKGSEWTHQAELSPPVDMDFTSEQFGDQFGNNVAIYKDTITIGESYDDDNGQDSGSAHIFVRSGNAWSHQATLIAPTGAEKECEGTHCYCLGSSVGIHDNTVIVGSHCSNSIYIFIRNGEEWTRQGVLQSKDGLGQQWFGRTVAVYGDIAIVGAELDWGELGSRSGTAHVFARKGDEWSHQVRLLQPIENGENSENKFGQSVDIYNGTVVVGSGSGEVYSFGDSSNR